MLGYFEQYLSSFNTPFMIDPRHNGVFTIRHQLTIQDFLNKGARRTWLLGGGIYTYTVARVQMHP